MSHGSSVNVVNRQWTG